MLKLSDLKIGESEEFKIRITLEDHNNFKSFSGDISPVHNDDSFAKSAGYDKKTVYGFHILTYLSRFYGNYLPGGSSVCLKQNIEFLKPVYLNENITIKGTITNLNKNLKLITRKNEILNENAGLCLNGEAILKMLL